MKLLGVRAGAGPGLNQGCLPQAQCSSQRHSTPPGSNPLSGFGILPTLHRSHRPVAEAPEVPSQGPCSQSTESCVSPPPCLAQVPLSSVL